MLLTEVVLWGYDYKKIINCFSSFKLYLLTKCYENYKRKKRKKITLRFLFISQIN